MRLKAAATVLTIALTACGEEQKGDPKFLAGQWQVKAELLQVEQPGNLGPPPSGPTEPQVIEFCMTPAQARQPDLDILAGSPSATVRCDGSVTLRHGKIKGENRCDITDYPAALQGRFEGEFNQDSYVLRGRTEQRESGRIVAIITQQWTGQRTGECEG